MKAFFYAAVVAVLVATNAATIFGSRRATAKSACGRVLSVGLADWERNDIVNKHNELRKYVAQGLEKRGHPGPQPPARNMEHMSYDNQLASVAQAWANNCNFAHDPERRDSRFYVGQNIGIVMTTGDLKTKPSDIIQSWYNEVAEMNKNQVPRFTNGNGVGHYTQLVWAKTNKIGCGKITFSPSGNQKKYLLVCNYGPGGNIINQPIYEIAN